MTFLGFLINLITHDYLLGSGLPTSMVPLSLVLSEVILRMVTVSVYQVGSVGCLFEFVLKPCSWYPGIFSILPIGSLYPRSVCVISVDTMELFELELVFNGYFPFVYRLIFHLLFDITVIIWLLSHKNVIASTRLTWFFT